MVTGRYFNTFWTTLVSGEEPSNQVWWLLNATSASTHLSSTHKQCSKNTRSYISIYLRRSRRTLHVSKSVSVWVGVWISYWCRRWLKGAVTQLHEAKHIHTRHASALLRTAASTAALHLCFTSPRTDSSNSRSRSSLAWVNVRLHSKNTAARTWM